MTKTTTSPNDTKYFYPDINDSLTIKMIGDIKRFPHDWGQDEDRVLSIAEKYIKRLATKNLVLIDAGCGEGRLIKKFEKYFSKIIAIEPDKSRLKVAERMAKENGFSNKVIFYQEQIEDMKKDIEADVIICSHVIQHVSTKMVLNILRKMSQLLKPGGLLIMLAPYSYGRSYHTKSYLEDGCLIEKKINVGDFNDLIINTDRILPVHFFSLNTLKTILTKSNFAVQEHHLFHFDKDDKARDILLLAIKSQ
jgi:SAM-dependent methyltransferase